MREQKPVTPEEVESQLDQMFRSIQADARFAARLEKDLTTRRAAARPARLGQLAWAGLSIVVVLILLLAWAGPNRVLAETRRLLGYLPGIGFADPESTRVLAEPVEVTREGITLRIEQVVANAERTKVIFSISGLPEDRPTEYDAPHYSLVFEDGTDKWDLSYHLNSKETQISGDLEFSELPPGAEKATLLLPRLPGVAEGVAPEDWTVPLQLKDPDQVARSYRPEGAQATINGMTVKVIEAAQSPTDTGLKIMTDWIGTHEGEFCGMTLQMSDDRGRDYDLLEMQQPDFPLPLRPNPTPTPPGTRERTYRFAPFAQGAHQAILNITQICWRYEGQGQGELTLDPGQKAYVGQTWTFDPSNPPVFHVGEQTIEVLSAQIAKVPEDQAGFDSELMLTLELKLNLNGNVSEFGPAFTHSQNPPGNYGGSSVPLENGHLEARLILRELPDRPLIIQLVEVTEILQGPWEIRWTLPQ